jgi:hypothetical protein
VERRLQGRSAALARADKRGKVGGTNVDRYSRMWSSRSIVVLRAGARRGQEYQTTF